MIDINLIPPAMRKDGEFKSPTINVSKDIILGVGILVILMVLVHVVLEGFGYLG